MTDAADNLGISEQEILDAERMFGEPEVKEEVKEEVTQEAQPEVKVEEKQEVETGVQNEPVAPKEDTDTEDDADHGEKSRLGRRLKRVETTFSQQFQELKDSLDFLKQKTLERDQVKEIQELEEQLPALSEYPTGDEIREYQDARERLMLKKIEAKTQPTAPVVDTVARQKYESEYIGLLKGLDPEDESDALLLKMLTDTKDLTYNSVHSNFKDAQKDFMINYRNATKALLIKKEGKEGKPLPIHGKPPKVPTGVNVPGSQTSTVHKVDRSKLDPLSKEAAEMFTDEELAAMGIK